MIGPTPAQIRAARALLDWSRLDLAKAASVSVATIIRAEGRESERLSDGVHGAIRVALETAGVDFIEDTGRGVGVLLRMTEPAGDVTVHERDDLL